LRLILRKIVLFADTKRLKTSYSPAANVLFADTKRLKTSYSPTFQNG